jgi:hypothetical protein
VLLTELKDDELLKLVALDINKAMKGEVTDGLSTTIGMEALCFRWPSGGRRSARWRSARSKGHAVSPVIIEGRAIVKTFWGKSWCENLEGYSDYANRLPRGRTYVRNGSVVDLQIKPGVINAWSAARSYTKYRSL